MPYRPKYNEEIMEKLYYELSLQKMTA